MHSKTAQFIQKIQTKVKNPITGDKQFKNKDEVIDLAVERLFDDLKRDKLV